MREFPLSRRDFIALSAGGLGERQWHRPPSISRRSKAKVQCPIVRLSALLRHVEEACRPLSIEVKRRETTDPRLAWDVLNRTGGETGYGVMGPPRGALLGDE